MSYTKKELIRAKELMSTDLHFIDGMATAAEAAELMRLKNTDTLLVHKRNENDAFGIVSVQDLVTKVILPERAPLSVNVYELMTKPIISVPADMDVRYVVRLMVRVGIRRAPVEENGAYIGMISLSSLILDGGLF